MTFLMALHKTGFLSIIIILFFTPQLQGLNTQIKSPTAIPLVNSSSVFKQSEYIMQNKWHNCESPIQSLHVNIAINFTLNIENSIEEIKCSEAGYCSDRELQQHINLLF